MRLINEIDATMTDDYPYKDHVKLDFRLTPSVVCNILPDAYPFDMPAGSDPFCFSCGVGVDSVAALVEMSRRGLRPDLITFADTGGEKPETYEYIPYLQDWLADEGFPPLLIVRLTPPRAKHRNLYDNMVVNETLPSIAFGRKSCSLRWKKEPQDAWRSRWSPIRSAWEQGRAVENFIGFDAAEDNRTTGGGTYDVSEDGRYNVRYLLREWNMKRADCVESIRRCGRRVPVKSACFFCPSSKKPEVYALAPILQDASVAMEDGYVGGRHWRGEDAGTVGLGRGFAWRELLANTNKETV